MSYIEGFVAAVPRANKEAYRQHAAEALGYFKKLGATRMVENWADDVPDGKVTDFKRSVKAKPDEDVIFSWLEYPDKATRDSANNAMMNDPVMKVAGKSMPFDGQRMIWGGFAPINDTGDAGKPGYVDGCVIPVPAANLDAYREMADKHAAILKEYGATRDGRCLGRRRAGWQSHRLQRRGAGHEGRTASSTRGWNGPARKRATTAGRRRWKIRA